MEKIYNLHIEIKGHTFPYGVTQQGQLVPMHDTRIRTTEENIFNIVSGLIGYVRQHEYPLEYPVSPFDPEYDELLKDLHNFVYSKETSVSIYDDGGLVVKYT